jgi:4'-phosphopantetheinyl transferase
MAKARGTKQLDPATSKWKLSDDGLHVWTARLDQLHPRRTDLTAADRKRAAGFLRPEVAGRWIASRWALRRVLSVYLDQAPVEIGILVGGNGKPRLATGGLEFNLSHSDELALIAVSRRRPVGVDVEKIEPARDLLALAERALDERTAARVRDATPGERAAVFYEAWVHHEARLKCRTGSTPAMPVAVRTLDTPPDYAAAVAVGSSEIGALRYCSLSDL